MRLGSHLWKLVQKVQLMWSKPLWPWPLRSRTGTTAAFLNWILLLKLLGLIYCEDRFDIFFLFFVSLGWQVSLQ